MGSSVTGFHLVTGVAAAAARCRHRLQSVRESFFFTDLQGDIQNIVIGSDHMRSYSTGGKIRHDVGLLACHGPLVSRDDHEQHDYKSRTTCRATSVHLL